jgi:hypothetical protein
VLQFGQIYLQPTISTEQGPAWEANSCSASQEILRLLCNSKVHYRVHNKPSLVPVLSQMYPTYFLKIHSNTCPSATRSSQWSCFPTKILYALLNGVALIMWEVTRTTTLRKRSSSVNLDQIEKTFSQRQVEVFEGAQGWELVWVWYHRAAWQERNKTNAVLTLSTLKCI